MNDLLARKRALLTRSEIYRQNLAADLEHLQAVTAWIPKALQYVRMAAPILALAAPFAGWLFRSRGGRERRRVPAAAPKRNLLGKMLAGYRIARQIKPVWDGFRRPRAHY